VEHSSVRGLLAFGIKETRRLFMLAAMSFWFALIWAQRTPLTLASAFIPALGAVLLIYRCRQKPEVPRSWPISLAPLRPSPSHVPPQLLAGEHSMAARKTNMHLPF
jgi:hypothetical protein